MCHIAQASLGISKRRAASAVALFCSGLLAGGAIDHSILALKGDVRTPYGVNVGVTGNVAFAALDLVAAAAAYLLYRKLS